MDSRPCRDRNLGHLRYSSKQVEVGLGDSESAE
jgi:hypothetical protein